MPRELDVTATEGLLASLRALSDGDFSATMDEGQEGAAGEVAKAVNVLAARLRTLGSEVHQIRTDIADEGRFGGQIEVPGATGGWAELVSDVNEVSRALTTQVRGVAMVVTARANGDFDTRLTLGARGEIKELEDTINAMGKQLSTFASEVSRVSREIGSEGRFGGQIEVPGLAGTWKELATDFNAMAASLTDQVRDIARVTREAASGQPGRTVTVGASGETQELKESLNALVAAR
jgi:HAMP domain-containing protein